MKFKSLIFLLLISCTTEFNKNYEKTSFSSSGFAYIYSEQDFNNKIIKKKFDNTKFLVAHSKLKTGTLIKLTNPNNNKSVNLKVYRKLDYPELYQVLITEPVANKLNLKKEVPYVEIEEIKKNKSFIAEKAITDIAEKKIANNAPIEKININNISRNKDSKKKKLRTYFIIIADFYSLKSAKSLKDRLINDKTVKNSKLLSIKEKNSKNYELFMGPYKTINNLKNDYIALIESGFEDLDIKNNE